MSGLTVTHDAVAALTGEVAVHGSSPAETGGFLLSRRESRTRLDLLALAGNAGIGRGRDVFKVSARAIERLFTWAGERDLLIAAQVHSHRGQAFLSPTDLRHGFAVEGFVTSVIPTYARPPVDPAAWGWWRYDEGHWQPAGAPVCVPGPAEVVRFDAGGVHGS
jgi:hypothetical protein